MTAEPESTGSWVDHLLALPGRGDFTNDEIDQLFARPRDGGRPVVMKNGRTWQLQEAKNRLSELIRRAQSDEPQIVTVRGVEAAVIISAAEFRRHFPSEARSLARVLLSAPRVLTDEDAEEFFLRRDADAGPSLELE